MSKATPFTKPRTPRIVLFDIETLPDMSAVMEVFPSLSDYPGQTLKATISSIICVGWKVLDENKVHCINAWDYPSRWNKDMNDDYRVVQAAYDVLKDADVVITHNGKRFDWKFLQTRLLKHGFPPLPKITHIDTCAEAKKYLLSFNNRLNTLGKFLAQVEKKDNGGWSLWVDVSKKKPEAMALMTSYCKQDVRVTEKVFNKLKPLIRGLPNANIFNGSDHSCPNCGSENLQKRGERVNKLKRVQRYQCQDCGAWSSEGTKHPMGETM